MKFKYQDKVRITDGFYRESVGALVECFFEDYDLVYKVQITHNPHLPSVIVNALESELELLTE